MKRFIVFALVLSVVLFSSFAATLTLAEFTEINEASSNQAGVKLNFTIDEDTGSFKFGFSSSEAHEAYASDTFNLAYSEGKVTNTEPLYVWWDIAYGGAYDLELSIDDALLLGGSTGDNDIELTIAGTGDETAVAIDTDAGTTSTKIITQLDGTTIVAKSGEQSLTISSADNALDGKAEGTYTANLTLKITTT